MTNKQRRKGFGYEREIVNELRSYGLDAKRGYGSNGQSLGHHEEVDVLLYLGRADCKELKIQCKRKKELPKSIGLTEHVDVSIVRQDRGESIIVMRLEDFIKRFLV